MKYIFFTIFTLCLLTGCNPNRTCEQTTKEPIPWSEATEYHYHGHSYIKFSDGYQGAVVHNPDCKCNKDKD